MKHFGPAIMLLSAAVSLTAADLSFELASIKSAQRGSAEPIGMFIYPGGRITINNCTLKMMVQFAYGKLPTEIQSNAGWIDSDRFTLQARAPAKSSAAEFVPASFKSPPPPETLAMLRTLLEDRFALRVHEETRQRNGFALTLLPKGAHLSPAKDANAYAVVASGRTDNPDRPDFLVGTNASMSRLAMRLSERLKVPVVDETGVTGPFDFRIEFSDADNDSGPSLFRVIQDELGLKLTSAKLPKVDLVIDQAVKPSEN